MVSAIDIANAKWFNRPMSNLPPGITGNEPEIAGYPESVNSGVCKECGLVFEELDFVWIGDEGVATCPECESEIWIEADGPDPDEWRERQREAAADRYENRGYDDGL